MLGNMAGSVVGGGETTTGATSPAVSSSFAPILQSSSGTPAPTAPSSSISPYLAQIAQTFAGGGKMRSPYRYEEGGNYQNIPYLKEILQGSPQWLLEQAEKSEIATHEDYGDSLKYAGGLNPQTIRKGNVGTSGLTTSNLWPLNLFSTGTQPLQPINWNRIMMEKYAGQGIPLGMTAAYQTPPPGKVRKYQTGGMYEQKANEMIAVNQLANLLGGMGANQQQPMLSSPIANRGMKMPKYDEGGATHTMPDGTVHPGATHKDYMAMMSGANSLYMANKGMKMPKRYTQGGKF
jgi:hypothetical protein